ncbi:hypothetical protein F0562_025989 [Nyssa sinensis]|uniref:Plant thionin family protein n=1 Tax=Nyssa sinensis TaxID=561372 RepID=A0A5J5BC71_9ASTE|nr:hypothetical protein F0562_025989 [Nyssa sinensis]
MAAKKFIATLLMTAMVIMACAEIGEAISDCAKDCMPTCMKVDGASISACEEGCENYCNQIGGGHHDAKIANGLHYSIPPVGYEAFLHHK